jgi:hypothetical protein
MDRTLSISTLDFIIPPRESSCGIRCPKFSDPLRATLSVFRRRGRERERARGHWMRAGPLDVWEWALGGAAIVLGVLVPLAYLSTRTRQGAVRRD